jgi:hypothetical protein
MCVVDDDGDAEKRYFYALLLFAAAPHTKKSFFQLLGAHLVVADELDKCPKC